MRGNEIVFKLGFCCVSLGKRARDCSFTFRSFFFLCCKLSFKINSHTVFNCIYFFNWFININYNCLICGFNLAFFRFSFLVIALRCSRLCCRFPTLYKTKIIGPPVLQVTSLGSQPNCVRHDFGPNLGLLDPNTPINQMVHHLWKS